MTLTPESIAASRYHMLGVLSMLLFLAAWTNVPNLPPGPTAALVSRSHLIQPGDSLDVKFVKNPELNEQPTIAPDGRISMLYAPNLEVAGKSTTAVRHPPASRSASASSIQAMVRGSWFAILAAILSKSSIPVAPVRRLWSQW